MRKNILDKNNEFKQVEKQYEVRVPNDYHLMIRLDGHKFSKFTKSLTKPYDLFLARVMDKTMRSLVEKFNANLGFTGSDEITLYFPKCEEKQTHPFGGRVQKIASLLSSYATLEFNNFWKEERLDCQKNCDDFGCIKTRLNKEGQAFFDARVFGVDTLEEVFENFKWRNHDVFRNAKTGFAQAFCSHKELQGKTANEQVTLTYEKHNKSFGESPKWFKYGTFCKKELYMKETKNGLVKRSRITTWSELLEDFKPELFDKYTNEKDFSEEV